MTSLPLFAESILPFVPLPDNAHQAIVDGLTHQGFARKAILDRYDFTSHEGSFKVNALVFADETRRTPAEYAGCTVYNATNGISNDRLVLTLAQTSAPFHIIHRDNSFSLWASSLMNNTIAPINLTQDVSYPDLMNVLQEFKADLAPDRIVEVKQGRSQFVHHRLRDIEPLQLTLWAIDITRKILVDKFGKSITELRLGHLGQTVMTDDKITKTAIQMLGATILADTGVLGESARHQGTNLQLNNLIQYAHERFPNYFQPLSFSDQQYEAVQAAYQVLRQICYSGFVPEMLSELYTTAYSKQERKKLGSYDTPLYLTRRILQNIPIEYLRPDQRSVVDMSCGWGSFLIASVERLSQLSDMRDLSLRDYHYGNDKDPFTAQLAGLGLLLSTSSDSWHIDNQDALAWEWLNENQANVIIGNPPFGGRRDQPETFEHLITEGNPKRVEVADAHLNRAVNQLCPGGYLAMIMPASFLTSESGPLVRKNLLKTCDIIEIWQLPGNTFSGASVQPIVLFAQKHSQTDKVKFPVRVRNIQNSTLDSFKHKGLFTISNIVENQSIWDEHTRRSLESQTTYPLHNYWVNQIVRSRDPHTTVCSYPYV